jgi:hypothetical protein
MGRNNTPFRKSNPSYGEKRKGTRRVCIVKNKKEPPSVKIRFWGIGRQNRF